jgi:Xaa-Pro dipeptidase
VIYTPNTKPKLLYFQPVDYWHKAAETPTADWVRKYDLVMITSPEQAKEHMPKGKIAFVGEWDESFAGWGDFTVNDERVLNRLHWDRAYKTEYELECMREANRRGARGHVAAAEAFKAGASDYEIHLAYLRATSHTDEELPYGNIIALNNHAAVLHYYHHTHDRDATRHSFLIDAGATYNGYASDITRTYSTDPEFAELIAAMETMQQELCAEVRPKVNYIDIHLMAHRKVAEILARFQFVDLDADAILERRISSTFLPHGVGHFIGIQVHDVGGFMADPSGKTIDKPAGHPYLRLTRTIEGAQVFTIEPGFYFIDPLLAELRASKESKHINWDKVDAFRKFGGIRIEDDVAVTDNGQENLTREAFAAVGGEQ